MDLGLLLIQPGSEGFESLAPDFFVSQKKQEAALI